MIWKQVIITLVWDRHERFSTSKKQSERTGCKATHLNVLFFFFYLWNKTSAKINYCLASLHLYLSNWTCESVYFGNLTVIYSTSWKEKVVPQGKNQGPSPKQLSTT